MPTKEQRADADKAAAMVDWARLDGMTDQEIEAAAISDPDNPPLTDEQLAEARLIVHRRRKKPAAAE